MSPTDFEVIVVDDGSTDKTYSVCKEFVARLSLKYIPIENSGISAAKNMGVFISSAPVLFFFDDDDIADPNLLEEHLRAHEVYPDESVAVLGRTMWHPKLNVTEVMAFATEVGCVLFSYTKIKENEFHGFKLFWGGRLSCKRSFLTSHGIFNQKFRFGYEDIELGYRLSRFGLRVVYNKNAVQFMNRAITLEQLGRRVKKQGASKFIFGQLHPDPLIQDYCQIEESNSKLVNLSKDLDFELLKVEKLESEILASNHKKTAQALRLELHECYRHSLNLYELEGFVEAKLSQLPMLKRLPIKTSSFLATMRGYFETRHN